MIYLAPIQGFTDFVYRKAYSQVFQGIDKYFIPYISVKNGQIIKKYEKEIQPENNQQENVIPQVLAKDSRELLFMAKQLEMFSYSEINLNLGCPYPMVTNRERGSGLLPHPKKIDKMLTGFFENSSSKLSVKLRAGLNSSEEIKKVIPVLNKFPLSEIILHPRIAKQLYKGEIIDSAFYFAAENAQHKLVFNGDIFEVEDFRKRKKQFSHITDWMLGRGILMNPFLPAEILGLKIPNTQKREKLIEFHCLVFDEYEKIMDNPGNVLNKMKQFWIYFSYSFPNQNKVLKRIKKCRNISGYQITTKTIFVNW